MSLGPKRLNVLVTCIWSWHARHATRSRPAGPPTSAQAAQDIADALLIDAGTSVAFGSVPGTVMGAMDVGLQEPAHKRRE